MKISRLTVVLMAAAGFSLNASAEDPNCNNITWNATALEQIPNAKQFITSFDRKNIGLEVRPANDRVNQIIDFIGQRPNQSGIIYCLSRKSTEQLKDRLQSKGIEPE